MPNRIADLGHDPDAHTQLEGEGDFDFEIVGESHYQDALDTICGGKTVDGHEHYCVAYLVPEPTNPHDRNAIAVHIDNLKVGHIPASLAPRMAAAMQGRTVTVDALIAGGWRQDNDEGYYGVRLDL